MTSQTVEAVSERLSGGRPSRFRALLAASVAAVAAGTLVYKMLRSADEGSAESGNE